MYKTLGKRLLDLIVSAFALGVASPVLLLLSILLAFANRGSILFLQERPGRFEKSFRVIKFKTMNDRRDSDGKLLPDNQRLTTIGKVVRNLSLDELPQLINVLKGDMSLVGPRPLLFKYLPLYSERQRLRHQVRPGITGWAQVNGRNSIAWTQKFRLDVEYVENISFVFDLKILWMTVLKVIQREGVNQSSERPMEPFNGSN